MYRFHILFFQLQVVKHFAHILIVFIVFVENIHLRVHYPTGPQGDRVSPQVSERVDADICFRQRHHEEVSANVAAIVAALGVSSEAVQAARDQVSKISKKL